MKTVLLGCFLLVGCGQEVVFRPHDLDVASKVRPDTPGNTEMFNYDATDVVQAWPADGGNYLVHYTLSGRNSVPTAVTNTDAGVPAYVENVLAIHEEVGALYHGTWGFRRAVSDEMVSTGNGGDGRFDVYLVDFGLSADGAFRAEACTDEKCAGYMVQENDFAGYGYPNTTYANRVLCSHEYFHAVQAAYDDNMGSIMAEGTAVWATEKFDPSLQDFENFIDAFFTNPDRSLDKPLPGPVDPFSYGSAVFFKFLDEKYGQDIIRKLWEDSENGAQGVADPTFLATLDALLQREFGSSFSQAMTEFATWNLMTGAYADSRRGYADSSAYPPVRTDTRTAPMAERSIRSFYASTQYYSFAPGGRAQVTARLVANPGAEADLEPLQLLLTTKLNLTTLGAIQQVQGGTQAPLVNATGVRSVVVAVVNTTLSGNSKRVNICAGTQEEVDACAASVAGVPDAGMPAEDAGQGGGSGGDAPTEKKGCLCASSAGETPWWLLAVVAVLVRRRACWA